MICSVVVPGQLQWQKNQLNPKVPRVSKLTNYSPKFLLAFIQSLGECSF